MYDDGWQSREFVKCSRPQTGTALVHFFTTLMLYFVPMETISILRFIGSWLGNKTITN